MTTQTTTPLATQTMAPGAQTIALGTNYRTGKRPFSNEKLEVKWQLT